MGTTKKYYVLVGILLFYSLLLSAQSHDTHLGNAINYINKGDYDHADKEISLVKYWGCEEEHVYHVLQMQNAYDYLKHCQTAKLPKASRDSMALYLTEECGAQLNAKDEAGYSNEAEKLCLLAIKMCEISFVKHHSNYAVFLLDMSFYYQQRNDVEKALEYGLKAVQVYKDNPLLSKDKKYCTVYFIAGGYYALMNDLVSAYPYFKEAYEACVKLKEPHPLYQEIHSTYLKSEGQMCGIYLSNGQYNLAEEHGQAALKLWRETTETQDKHYAALLDNLAFVYDRKADYTKALNFYMQSLSFRKSLYGEKHEQYAKTLNDLGGLYADMGDYNNASLYLKQAIQICEQLGKKDTLYATILSGLGYVYDELENYREAEKYLNQALLQYKILGKDKSSGYAATLNNVAILSLNIGNIEKAKQYSLSALDIYETIYGKEHIECATTLNNLGTICEDLKEYDLAEQYYLRSLKIKKSVLGDKHPDCATTLDNLGALSYSRGDYRTALTYHLQAWHIRKAVYGEQNINSVHTLNNIASLYGAIQDYEHALTYHKRAYDIATDLYGDWHPLCRTLISNLGSDYYEMGDCQQAEPYLLSSYNLIKQQFLQSLEFMTESQREKFWQSMEHEFMFVFPNFAYDFCAKEPRYAGMAYTNELFYKGALLQSSEAIKRSVLESGDASLIRQWNTLTELRKQIVYLQENEPTSPSIAEYEQQAEQMEKNLTQSSAIYRENQQQWEIKWEDVRSALQSNQVAIEFTSVLRNADSTVYCAMLLRKSSKYPQFIPLFEEKEVSAILQSTTPDQQYAYTPKGLKLSKLIWFKILPHLHSGEVVYFAPTGILHQIAIETLPLDAEHSVASKYHLVRLSSTRELVKTHLDETHSSAVLYGGIFYDMEMSDLTAYSDKYSTINIASTRSIVDESMRAGVHYLPGTKSEVEAINAILQPNHIKASVYTSGAANEESFKALNGQHKNILHIATHGFYWTDSTAREQRYFAQRSTMMDDKTTVRIDPLTRSGLLFAGANIALRGHSNELPQNVQDGILTSKEISLLDLRGANMVVLSACETGKGEVTGEGVFGLQRAFKMAGAQSIMMSLWPVDDEATQLMTTEFYRFWIEKHENKRDAFMHAQEVVRKKYKEPRYWAAFILSD